MSVAIYIDRFSSYAS